MIPESPCLADAGLRPVMTAAPALMIKPLIWLSDSPPVTTETVRTPGVAFAAMVMFAVAVSGLLITKEFSVIPSPKEALVSP